LPLEERLRLVAEIAGAVAAAHSVGIIHKDLKPSNVFMRRASDGRWHPMPADFGIGAVADRSQLEQRGITVAGFSRTILEPGSSRTGTRMYQPPEANLARPATVQGDVYALGVLLYQMVIGDFDQPLGVGWERRLGAARAQGWAGEPHREGEAPPEPRSPTVPTPVSPGAKPFRTLDPSGELVLRLLQDDIGACVDGDPSARLATAAQLVERLQTMDQRVADGLARRRAERAALRMCRLRAALAAAVAALVIVGGLGAFAFTEWRLAQTLKEQADRARRAADANAAAAIEHARRAVENEQRATRNEQRAVENEQRAEESARQARASATAARQQSQLALDTLSTVIFDIQGSVENLSGSSPIRRRLLITAMARLEKLSGEFVKHSSADRHTAVALSSMGDLVLRFGEPPRSSDVRGGHGSGGELRGAAESARQFYTRSMEIFQALAQADPNDAQAKRDLSISYNKLGDVHLQLGATDRALQSYQKGLELSEALAQAVPRDAQAQRVVSISYQRLGDVHLRLGATDQALRAYQKGLELSQALAEANPHDAQAQRDLAVS
jgi:serine/threonine-protein kinase